MTSLRPLPLVAGMLMGLMMLWMAHGAMTGSEVSGIALVAFVGAHLLVALIAVGAIVFAARLTPNFRARLARLHRPNLNHFTQMLAGAVIAAGTVHLIVHGIS